MITDNAVCSLIGFWSSWNPNFAKQIIFSEAHFWMNGYVNK